MLRQQLSIAALVAAFAAMPLAASARAQDRDDHARDDRGRHEQRVYDTARRDYHTWDADEERHLHEFMDEHHRHYKDYWHLSKKQQREYWQWRHDRH